MNQLTNKNKRIERLFKKYFKVKYVLISLIAILLLSLFNNIFKALILIAIFLPLVVWTFQVSRFIPHINIETLSASTLLLGYIFGPLVALIFGLSAGMFGLFKANFIRYLMVVRIIVTALVGFGMAFFTNIDFNLNFIIGILAMNIILYFIYLVIDPDPIQNVTHRASHLLWNLFLVRFIFVALYYLINLL